ncbi:hypothetical protein ACFQX7_17740 [Luedemannella flava]|uniref:hypothetical protein n=1 Tax=Luedemannella flava TaxID=349316 RepID=UPI0031E3FC8B
MPLTPELADHYRRMLRVHADDPVTGTCPVCRRSRCEDFHFARTQLVCAGERLDLDLS